MMKTEVVIVDDHLLITKAIASIINEFDEFMVVFEAKNGRDFIEKLSQYPKLPDIVLLDVSMPEMNGLETAAWLTKNHPEILIMALSVQDDEDTLMGMIKNGAKGYMHKNVHPDELEKSLKVLRDTGMYFPAWANSKIVNSISSQKKVGRNPYEQVISSREKEFLNYVCQELTYKEIAAKMYCSPRTVEGYRDSLFEKLDIHSRVGLALFAVKNGFYTI